MPKKVFYFILVTVFALISVISTVDAGQNLEPSGKNVTVWFDTGGPVGGPYNTIVQNGALQAAADWFIKTTSDWWRPWPKKVFDNHAGQLPG
jgi:simple sugar transport system substrate-binding protein